MSPLNPDVEKLFEKALDQPRPKRSAFLDEACRSAPELRRAVEELLQENDRLTGFLPQPAFGNSGAMEETAPGAGRYLPAGVRLGRYTILEPLGSGGMGVVYRARDGKLERTVALKTLATGMWMGSEGRRHFQREALALAKLNHPHIAVVYDVGEQDGLDYIVMELVEGHSLAEKLQGGALPVAEATRIMAEVASALEEAHHRGVIHRDLKPGNVMVTPKGHAKVLDFGLAKLLTREDGEAAKTMTAASGVLGTPLYMSPEQAHGAETDERTDLWSLGVLYYEALTGKTPFAAKNGLGVLRAIAEETPAPMRSLRPELPVQAERIVERALEKEPRRRYQSAAEMGRDAEELLLRMSGAGLAETPGPGTKVLRWALVAVVLAFVGAAAAGWWFYRRTTEKRWARDEAIPEIDHLINVRQPLKAFDLMQRAEKDLPEDGNLRQVVEANTMAVRVTSEPAGAQVEIQDYMTPDAPWRSLGSTPIAQVRIPNGYFRWKISKAGVGSVTTAPVTQGKMDFPLAQELKAPQGMVYVPAGPWGDYSAFLGWLGPYDLPAYSMDRDEVTNREYQKFVDDGGYANPKYWPASFEDGGKPLTWSEAMAKFRDTTGRPGPSTWVAGHFPDGRGDYPVSGVSWYEASAYAAFAGKSLPILGQWYKAAPPDVAEYAVPMSNIVGKAPAPVGKFQGLGPYGTDDMAGNVREWVANEVDDHLRFILGGSWKSQAYLYTDPEALSPFDRADGNGFRCVRNLGALPANAVAPYHRVTRDFAKYKPVSDAVFQAYKQLYDYAKAPLNAQVDGVVHETDDWREVKVTINAAYNGERLAVYLFLPKRVKPPYQTVLFFPSARVLFLPNDSSNLGDTEFFDYVVQSGRAVAYPVYEDTYERRLRYSLPAASQDMILTTDWYKDAARTLDYLETRQDIDSSKLAYMGVSMGAAYGAIISSLLQDRLKAVVFLDGGYFLGTPPPGGDQADFVTRLKKPVLMVNGRYDYTFPPDKAQNPMFNMLATPPSEKKHVILDTPHDVDAQRPVLVKSVLDWLDKYLGRVGG
ncbi:MAG TPA: protein kinase [Terracidiphilus sp.]|nr:protein kinase [Terracidiphilus sp.]